MNETNEKHSDEKDVLEARLQRWHEANPEATLTDMEHAVDAELTRLRQELLGSLVTEEAVSDRPSCLECGQEMVRNGRKRRQVRTKDNEVLKVERLQWRCLRCGMTLFPPG